MHGRHLGPSGYGLVSIRPADDEYGLAVSVFDPRSLTELSRVIERCDAVGFGPPCKRLTGDLPCCP